MLHREGPISRDFLAYLLWSEDTEENAKTKLRANLYDLTRVLPPAPPGYWILVDGDNLRWNPEVPLRLDVDDFLSAAADPARYEETVDLYAGDLLEQLYDEWVFPVRERLRNVHLSTLIQLVSSARRQVDFPRAIGYAQRILAIEPFREDVVRRLIALRNESGDRAGALHEYRRFAEHVRAELGIDPMPETTSVRDAIARGESFGEAGEAEEPEFVTREGRTPLLPFVGRQAETEQLLDAWSRAVRGRGGAIFIGGEPGIGKSRLALELAHEVQARGGRVLLGSTGSPEAIPYQCFVSALRSAMPLVESLRIGDVWLSTLATLLPELQGRGEGVLPPPRVDPAGERARLFEALTRAFVGLARARPLLLVLEDLHWAEEATIAALAALLRRIALAPLLVVATFRDNEAPRLHPLQRLRRDAAVDVARSLSLRPLALSDLEELAPILSTHTNRPAQALLVESEGNPLFLTQLLADEGPEPEGSAGGLRGLVNRRVERLSPKARAFGEIAALIGLQFSRAAVSEVCGWDEGQVGDALDELIDRRFVRELAGRGLFDYEFGHEIVREAIADAGPSGRAAERHRRIAVVLDELMPERAAEIAAQVARHYELAGDAPAAAQHYLTGARRAIELGALDAAGAQLERAVELAVDLNLRANVLLERDRLARRTGDRTLRESAVREFNSLSESLDGDLKLTVLLSRLQFAQEFEDEAAQRAALLRLQSPLADTPRWRAVLHMEASNVANARGDLDQSFASSSAALEAYREAGDESGAARSLLRLADVETLRGALDRAGALLDEARATAERARDGSVELESLKISFYLAYSRVDSPLCLSTAEQWLERGMALGDRFAEAAGRVRIALTLNMSRSRYMESFEQFALAEAFYIEVNDRRGIGSVLLNRGVLQASLGQFSESLEGTTRAIEIFKTLQDTRGLVIGLVNSAMVRAHDGDPVLAAAEAREALQLAQTGEFGLVEASALENLAIAEAISGDLPSAIEHGEAALLVRKRTQSEAWTGKMLADLALWYAASGDLSTARDRIERMLANEPCDLGTEWPQCCHWAAAQILHTCGDVPRATQALGRAQAVVAAYSAQLDAPTRERFLTLSWNRAILAAAEEGLWPEPAPV